MKFLVFPFGALFIGSLIRLLWLSREITKRLKTVHPEVWARIEMGASSRAKHLERRLIRSRLDSLGDADLVELNASRRAAMAAYFGSFCALAILLFLARRHVV